MKFEIIDGKKYFYSDERWFWQKDRSKPLVLETDERAAVLYAAVGTRILEEAAYEYGILRKPKAKKSVIKKVDKAMPKKSNKAVAKSSNKKKGTSKWRY